MKKIALLFTILCAGALNGMESSEPGRYVGLGDLSPEVQAIIVQALNTYNNLPDIIKAIKAMSLTNQQLNAIVNDMYGDQKGFTKLISILAKKFPDKIREDIANQFNTPIAKEYIRLGKKLAIKTRFGSTEEVAQTINEGADVNYSFNDRDFDGQATSLFIAILYTRNHATKLLLNAGADPYFKTPKYGTAFDLNKKAIQYAQENQNERLLEEGEIVTKLLEAAIKK